MVFASRTPTFTPLLYYTLTFRFRCTHTHLDAVKIHVSLVAMLLIAFLWADTSPTEQHIHTRVFTDQQQLQQQLYIVS